MRRVASLSFLFLVAVTAAFSALPKRNVQPSASAPETALRAIYTEALGHGRAFDNLHALVTNHPGRLAGSTSLDQAVDWAREQLNSLQLDRVWTQDVTVPHWERGEPEAVFLLDPTGTPALSACALGGSGATPAGGLLAEVIEVHSIDELPALGTSKLQGRIVFFNRPMDPTAIIPGRAYGGASDQRTRGPGAAAKLGAVGALVRSLTHAHDDIPHTGVTIYPPDVPNIPAAALSPLAADRLAAALAEARRNGTVVRVGLKIGARRLTPEPSHNVIGEIRGAEFPEQILLVGAHLDSWDISPGAHDDGAGIVQSIEVLRIFRALGLKPRHTLRCVLFVNEENGNAGGLAYAAAAKSAGEKHVFALESDAGGFQPRGFNITSAEAAERAARWLPLLHPYGLTDFRHGDAGVDVTPLVEQGVLGGELLSDSQRYFDIHHTSADTLDKVNPRELHLGAAALASLLWLIDQEGL